MQVPTDSSLLDATGKSFMLFATVIFTVGVLFYIFKPVPAEHGVEKTRLAYLYERKEQTFENLRDLNFEYKAGKLSDADFTSMRDSMEQEAANILAEIEELEHESGNRQWVPDEPAVGSTGQRR
jgi:cbb3-type cytochrome oxidase subunit 3